MSLDLALMNEDGRPVSQVRLAVAQHRRLIEASAELDLPLLQRMRDFYEDVEYSAQEMGPLAREVERLHVKYAGTRDSALADDMRALIDSALAFPAR